MGLLFDIIILQFFGLITVKIFNIMKDRFLILGEILEFFLKAGKLIRKLCHFIIAKILFVPIEWFDKHSYDMHGRSFIENDLTPENIKRKSFLKEVLIATAPIWIGTYLSYKLLDWYRISEWIVFKFLIIICMITILCFTVPTFADYKGIFKVIMEKPFIFFKQLIFLIISYLIYNYNFDYFYKIIPHYHNLYDFVLILSLEGILELIFIGISFIFKKIDFLSSNNSVLTVRSSRKYNRYLINQVFPNKKGKRKKNSDLSTPLFSLLPDDDETAAEEFKESMIRESKLMIDIKNKGINSK